MRFRSATRSLFCIDRISLLLFFARENLSFFANFIVFWSDIEARDHSIDDRFNWLPIILLGWYGKQQMKC